MIFSGARRFGLLLAGARWRWLVAALVASLVSVGVSAWGPESAQAGLYKDVQLTVVNQARGSVPQLTLCTGTQWVGGAQHCPFNNFRLEPGDTVAHTAEDVAGFMASSAYSGDVSILYLCDFSAYNPSIGEPYIRLKESGSPYNYPSTVYPLSEGEKIGPIYCDGFEVVLQRKDDTSDAKVMQITITKVPNERLISVSAGGNHTCGVRPDKTVACWGGNLYGQARPPEGTFKSVSAGGQHTCGVRTSDTRTNDTVACWGKNSDGQASPPTGTFRSVSAGRQHTCGVRTNDTVACWGKNSDGQASPPTGTFRSVSAGGQHTCGVRTNDTVACWGKNSAGQASPPTGTFRSVSAGGYYTCGVRTNDTVACWGSDSFGHSSPPTGTFRSVSAGGDHTCGVRTNDTVACWGYDYFGQARPPEGTFKSVSAGFDHTCGVRTNDTVACWGDNSSGQS